MNSMKNDMPEAKPANPCKFRSYKESAPVYKYDTINDIFMRYKQCCVSSYGIIVRRRVSICV